MDDTENELNQDDSMSDVGSEETKAPAESDENADNGTNDRLRLKTDNVNAKEILTKIIVDRCSKATNQLRAKLRGKILFEIDGKDENYLLDWSKDNVSVSEASSDDVDLVINLSERTLVDIYRGVINAQIALLSDKIEIDGDPEKAVYIFNLLR